MSNLLSTPDLTSGPREPRPTWRTSIPIEGRGWLVAASILWLTGWLKGINLILILAYLLVLLFVLNWIAARRRLRGVTASRRIRRPVFAASPFVWEVDVATSSRRPIAGWSLHDQGAAHSMCWFLSDPRNQRLRREVTLPKRGLYQCEPLRAVSAYPFGLVKQTCEFGKRDQLTVLPQLGKLHLGQMRRWLVHTARPDERARRTRRRLSMESEFHGLRQFRPGDSPRWIHWRTTARTGELVVREFDQGTHHDLILIVEPFAGPKDASAAESAISMAATICSAWSKEAGDRIVLGIASEPPIVVTGGESTASALELLEALAVAPVSLKSNLVELERRLSESPLPSGQVLWISSRGDARSADQMSERLQRPIVFIDVRDPPEFYQPPEIPRPDPGS